MVHNLLLGPVVVKWCGAVCGLIILNRTKPGRWRWGCGEGVFLVSHQAGHFHFIFFILFFFVLFFFYFSLFRFILFPFIFFVLFFSFYFFSFYSFHFYSFLLLLLEYPSYPIKRCSKRLYEYTLQPENASIWGLRLSKDVCMIHLHNL